MQKSKIKTSAQNKAQLKNNNTNQSNQSKEQLIERLLAKSELDFKCCSSSCGHIAVPTKSSR